MLMPDYCIASQSIPVHPSPIASYPIPIHSISSRVMSALHIEPFSSAPFYPPRLSPSHPCDAGNCFS
ncbi:hypothetical protein BJX62DRAFT_192475 [Aspergillus germanicus]